MNTRMWTTQDGRKIRIKDMTTEHLDNAIKLLERFHYNRIAEAWMVAESYCSDLIAMHAEDEAERLEEYGPSESAEIYDDLIMERERRKSAVFHVYRRINA